MTPERRALFLAGQHCQGGHSDAGAAIADLLGVPFPLDMKNLIEAVRREGENPAGLYPWLRRQQIAGYPPYFTYAEIDAAAEGKAP